MKDDTISRAAAIDAVNNMIRRKFGISADLGTGALLELPSATDTNVGGNLIDRQAALDAIKKLEKPAPTAQHLSAIFDCEDTIKALPSAQPESCEYYALCRHGRDENKLRARLGFCEYCNEDADGYVKPIEKNCHAFIRFGMNGWELSLKANGWHGSAKIRYCPMCGRDLLVK